MEQYMNQKDREEYMISLAQALHPEERVDSNFTFKGTTIHKLCEYDGGGYKRMIGWLEDKVSELPTQEEKPDWVTPDSGEKRVYSSGYQRDTNQGKLRYDLIPRDCLKRLALRFTQGAEKYGDNNWQKAHTKEEFDSFKESAMRHFMQWMDGETDEDHATATIINIMFYEHTTNLHESSTD